MILHTKRSQILHFVALLLSCATMHSVAEKLHLVKCSVSDTNIVNEYRYSDSKDVEGWILRFSEMIHQKNVKVDYETSCEIQSDVVTTNNFLVPIKYLIKTSTGLFELKDDLKEGRQIECVINGYHNDEYAFISLCSKKTEMLGRDTFDPIPEWNVGKPVIEEYVELKIDKRLFAVNRWDVFHITETDGLIEINAIKLEK